MSEINPTLVDETGNRRDPNNERIRRLIERHDPIRRAITAVRLAEHKAAECGDVEQAALMRRVIEDLVEWFGSRA